MATLQAAREAMYQQFVTAWGATTPYTFDNEIFDPPEGVSWIRLSVRHTRSNQETLGGLGARKFRRGGACIVQVFAPQGQGVRAADILAQQARAIFEGITLVTGSLWFTDVIVQEVGESEGWYQINVEALFDYDEVK